MVYVYVVKRGNLWHIYDAKTYKSVKVNIGSFDKVIEYCERNSLYITEVRNG